MASTQEATPANDQTDVEAVTAERERTGTTRRTRRVGDVDVPREADRYKILRYHEDGTAVPMSLQLGNERVEVFSLKHAPPLWARVLEGWGSGTYRFHWYGPPSPNGKRKGGAIGRSSPKCWDDPQHPQLPAYRRTTPEAPTAQPVAAAVAAQPVAATPMGALLGSQADASGRVDLGTAMVFMQAMAAQARESQTELEERHRRWRVEDDERALRREQEHRRELETMRERAANERKETAEYWQRMGEASLELRARERGDDVEDEIADLRESMAALAKTSQASQDMWTRVFEVVAPAIPVVLQKFMGSATPALKKEGT
jgi:hypothetical protein